MKNYIAYSTHTPFTVEGIYTAYDFYWEHGYSFAGEQHDFCELVAILSGNAEIVDGAKTYHLHSGNMLLHAPEIFHRLKSIGEDPVHMLVLTFSHTGELPTSLFGGVYSLEEAESAELLQVFQLLRPYVRAMRGKQESGRSEQELAYLAIIGARRLEAFLLTLGLRSPNTHALSTSAGALEYRNLVHLMRKRVCEPLTLSDIAAARHVSPSYVKKLFAAFAGKSAMSYFADLRVSEIKRLLDEGLPLFEISERMGFSSPSYLSAFFKKQTGVSPMRYRLGK